MLRLLVVDGNERAGRERHVARCGKTSAETYAGVLRALAADVACDRVAPADADGDLPVAVEAYDGVVFTGSTLHVAEGGPAVRRQIELMRAALEAGVPVFGSCWGVQVAAAVAGGEAGRNPRGPEYGFARNIAPTAAGREHPLLAGRPAAYDAPAIHDDAVLTPPPGSTVLAGNGRLDVQAIEVPYGPGLFWGTQYHPELDLDEVAAMLCLSAGGVVAAGLCRGEGDVAAQAEALRALHADPRGRPDLAWRLGLGEEVTAPERRRREIRNFLDGLVRPRRVARGR
ncbi:glutamine amidotransferase class-I [Methylobacterium sp. 4-46]|uniref:type 1 glutamine amidotransferase n=1 Tax=unclassified Methylobacterium TaxID=2615210 RepID=UPI000152EA54|nr:MULTISPECIES: type 1 glutamine amidotransferase [Methylobacterium]ACA21022.1 glutamine amidotransferase class-I [Methylobacterium sp. 4-46]WFT80173.1 type 1 glutamine amidotransferase [Methylobacterium nodulans]